MVKVTTYTQTVLLSLFFIAFLPLISCSTIDNFLQCLQTHSLPSNPIQQFLYTPNNSSFPTTLNLYAKSVRILATKNPKPLAIVAAAHESHVQSTVTCAKSHDLQIRIRSGGHDYEGLSYVSDVPFVILDMFNLRKIDININEETAWVQSGAILGELYYAIAQKSKVHAFPSGVCPSMGTGGHFSGGGYGNLVRKYGISVDNIIDAQLVDVNGKILNRETMGEDLFWAIRGGGGASFGVILSWKIKLVSVPEKVTVFRVERTIAQGAVDIALQWQQVATKLPKELFIRLETRPFELQNRTTIKLSFVGQYLGQKATLLPLMSKEFPKLGFGESDGIEMSWIESTAFWFGLPNGTPIEDLLKREKTTNGFSKYKSDYVKKPLSKKSLETIYKMLMNSKPLWMQWNPYGGRMSEISESEVPYPHRKGVIFKIQYLLQWKNGKDTEHYMDVSRKFHEAMAPYVSNSPREAFLNYIDLDIGSNPSNYTRFEQAAQYGAKYFKANFQRLVKVKAMADPTNFFKNEQSIPSDHKTLSLNT